MSDDIKKTDKRLLCGKIVRDGKTYGCHCNVANDDEVDGCVIDTGDYWACIYAKINGRDRRSRWTCKEWKPLKATQA